MDIRENIIIILCSKVPNKCTLGSPENEDSNFIKCPGLGNIGVGMYDTFWTKKSSLQNAEKECLGRKTVKMRYSRQLAVQERCLYFSFSECLSENKNNHPIFLSLEHLHCFLLPSVVKQSGKTRK